MYKMENYVNFLKFKNCIEGFYEMFVMLML